MSGKRAKARRREEGVSIAARRGMREFEHLVEQTRFEHTLRRYEARRGMRKALSACALAIIAALVGFGLSR